jgi:formate C-acetyltransferase
LRHFIDIKIRGNQLIEQMYAKGMPAPFLSMLIDDCIQKGKDYNDGGPRYNNTFIQMVGLGSVTDCLSAIKQLCFDGATPRESCAPGPHLVLEVGPRPFRSLDQDGGQSLARLVAILDCNFAGEEVLRQRLVNRTHKYGNDNDYADDIMRQAFNACFQEIDGRPNTKGGHYRVEMLPTTCHIYFGLVTGAMPDGRLAGLPLSEGISPVQGADRRGPTAVFKSAGKMDHVKTGGTLLNLKFTPSLLAIDDGLDSLAHLVRSYFKMGGHHVQFNVVTAEILRHAQTNPEQHRDLIVRVAGYSDYFCDLAKELQDEIIARTEHNGF